MPYKDPEQARARDKRYYQANRDRERERRREYYLRNREAELERNRRYTERNTEKIRKLRSDYQKRKGIAIGLLRHGMRPEDWAAMVDAQDGRCYLCGDRLPDDRALIHVDHDHRCCPRLRSCRDCRRGLACSGCNIAVGCARNDPDRLRRMADALEAANARVTERLAQRQDQATLFDLGEVG